MRSTSKTDPTDPWNFDADIILTTKKRMLDKKPIPCTTNDPKNDPKNAPNNGPAVYSVIVDGCGEYMIKIRSAVPALCAGTVDGECILLSEWNFSGGGKLMATLVNYYTHCMHRVKMTYYHVN